MASPLRAYVLDENGRYESATPHARWLPALDSPVEIVKSYNWRWDPPPDAGVIIAFRQYEALNVSVLRRLTEENRVPVLILADGILEYRNTWTNTLVAPGALFQPVMGHKIACLGRSQIRIVESWGNLGKCELVGAPRLDSLLGRSPRQRPPQEPFRVLVMTANNPGFTDEQRAHVRRSLMDLKGWLHQNRRPATTEIRPVWRLAREMAREIGVKNESEDLHSDSLYEALNGVDAMITTPSTAMLEGMLQGVPVALLDYNNCPHYVPAAWAITAREHLDRIIPELIDPPETKLLYQDTILHDSLECRSPAICRMVWLVEEMIRIGHQCRSRNRALHFPRRILPDPQDGHHFPEERFHPGKLYPDHPVFSQMDRLTLQVELGHFQFLCEKLQEEISTSKQQETGARRRIGRYLRGPILQNLLGVGRRTLGRCRRMVQSRS